MSELIHQYTTQIQDGSGATYSICAVGQARADGTWEAWLEFLPVSGGEPKLSTERETSQPDRSAVAYWASGLEPLYFEGAFNRAKLLHEKRKLQRMEDYVLGLFRQQGKARMSAVEVFNSTAEYKNSDLAKAFDNLERNRRLLIRYRFDNDEWLQLMPAGMRYLGTGSSND